MTTNHQTFQETFRILLEKSSVMTNKEIDSLVTLFSCLIDNPAFSLKKTQETAKDNFNRNFFAKTLVKYGYVQRLVAEQLITEIVDNIPKTKTFLLSLDDTVVYKCGKHIEGSHEWHDHSKGRVINGFCLVNLALVVEGQLLFVLPWLLLKDSAVFKNGFSGQNIQDIKTKAAIELLDEVVKWLEKVGIPKRKIVVVTDSWYSNKTMVEHLKEKKLNYRLDARSNLSVQCPDHEAIKKRGEKRRGRKRKKFVCYVSLKAFMGNYSSWKYFVDKSSDERIYHHTAIITLKKSGRVTVYAFRKESTSRTKFIITPPKRIRPSSFSTVYCHYRFRWRIEEAHRDLKQQFGLSRCQARRGWVVSGFVGLVFLGYSFWKFTQFITEKIKGCSLKCPSWAQSFRNFIIRKKMTTLS